MKEINKVLETSEKILWEGKPNFWPFFFGRSIITTIFGGIFLVFVLFWFISSVVTSSLFSEGFAWYGILLVPHFWIGIVLAIGIPIYNLLLYKHVYYAITNKRVILQSGVIGRDFEIIDFDQITNAEVNVGVFDKLFCASSGSILLSGAGTFTSGRHGTVAKPYTLSNISHPYEVFKFFKKVSHDVKTDIQYPNRFRPKTNPGYRTQYTAAGKKR